MASLNVCSVSAITARIQQRLEDMPTVTVEGEVSNLSRPNASGHLYFSLIDDKAKLNAVFFAFRRARQTDFQPFQNGEKIRATGRIAVYAPNGSYSLNVERIERCDTHGDLLKRFEALKAKLKDEGLFEPSRKRPLPLLPKRVGIVTASTGAAIRDILTILGRRFPNLHIIVAPCRVQGAGAAEEIAAAIELLNQHFAPDTSNEPMDAMIVGRGGGSYEELWCFSEEIVARAVANSKIPVISAVGHEPDIAMTDYVADLRASTPSAAAELLCGRKEDFEQRLADTRERLVKALRIAYLEARNKVRTYEAAALFRDPLLLLATYAQQTDNRENRLKLAQERLLAWEKQHLSTQQLRLEKAGNLLFEQTRSALQQTAQRLDAALQTRLSQTKAHLAAQCATLTAVDPNAVLKRGYALVTDENGTILADAATVTSGDTVNIRLATSALTATVTQTSPSPQTP